MADIPELSTGRLKLRGFTLDDVPVVAELCGEWEIAATTAHIPHPYDESMAEEWIGTHQGAFENEEAVTFAITRVEDNRVVGAIGLQLIKSHRGAEVGYWVGKPY